MKAPDETTGLFWRQRLRQHGHTGWSDPVLYAFDQLERLAIVKSVVSQKPINNGMALDFGCGIGDFSRLLIEMGFAVCGYDPFVRPKIHSSKFLYASAYEQIPFRNQEVDLALTVTALTHILKELDFHDALKVIRECMKPDGDIYMLEYALDSTADRDKYALKSDYQFFRTVSQWEQSFRMNSFRILSIMPLPQPLISPSSGFLAYKRTHLVQIGRRCSSVPVLRSLCSILLKWQANKYVQARPMIVNVDGSSPLKLIHCSIN